MTKQDPENSDSVGLARFHKITIGAGIALTGAMAWRYWRWFKATDENHYLVYSAVALILALSLSAYLWRFAKGGL